MNQKIVGSVGEKLIRKALKVSKVKFIFDAPISFAFNKYPAELSRKRYDFVLIDSDLMPIACIEYDGQQHYEPKWYGRSLAEFKMACDSDEAKTHFCEENKLPLLRIRYDQNDLIEDLISDFLAHPRTYIKKHNPEISNKEYFAARTAYLQAC